jgi:hypothetical protein
MAQGKSFPNALAGHFLALGLKVQKAWKLF